MSKYGEFATIKPIEFDGFIEANIEGMNAEFIRMGLAQSDRLVRLNGIAIRQLQSLTCRNAVKALDFKPEPESTAKRLEAKKTRGKKGGAE
ncbi:MAG: hypothetical protein ABIF71_09465 [Planctomycetota bacterium]